ncbi:MAG: phage portal protein [Pseudomonadota bacterium]
MGLFRNLFARAEKRSSSEASWAALKHRGLDASGPMVVPRVAEGVAAYTAAIGVISSAISSFPCFVYKRDVNAGREMVMSGSVPQVIAEPNEAQTWPELIESLIASMLDYGNGCLEIEQGGAGEVRALHFVPWQWVTPRILASGRLVFDVAPPTGELLTQSRQGPRRLLPGEYVLLKDRSDDGRIGRSRLSRCGGPIRAGMEMQAFQETLYKNGAQPGVILSADGPVPPESAAEMRDQWDEEFSGDNAGRIAVLGYGLKAQPWQFNPENLEMIAARRFSVEEIARLFQVPPPLIADYSNNTFTNSQQAAIWFAQHTLQPIVRKLEEALRRGLFTPATRPSFEIEFDMSALLRGDATSRWQAHEIAVRNSILTTDEIREVEGWNPIGQAPENTD